ncbi:MAG: glycosyltransferase family 4 protein [Proteobacteria bacterium]|nr:glycosyltransferase family 4 protein [Pseudomonadota bacterium]
MKNRCFDLKAKRVLVVEPLGDGGIAHYTFNLLDSLANHLDSIILFTNRRYELIDKSKQFKVFNWMFLVANWIIIKLPSIDQEHGIFTAIRRVIKIIEYPLNIFEALLIVIVKKIDIVHFQSVNLIEVLMVIVFKLFDIKIIYTVHNVRPLHKELRFYHKWILWFTYSLCNEIIAHTIKGKEEIAHLFKVSKDKIHVIPHGDYNFFIPDDSIIGSDAKSSLHIDPKFKTILFFGAIRENKGLANILTAMPKIIEHVPEVLLLIVGEPCGDYSKYQQIITEQNIADHVWEKLGYIPNEELPVYFFASDMVVLPYNEVTGSGILQVAYAFSKPVVANDLDGFRETIVDGENGYLAKTGDMVNLAEKCIEILMNREKQNRMGSYSKYLADTKYSWDLIAQKTKEIYFSIK